MKIAFIPYNLDNEYLYKSPLNFVINRLRTDEFATIDDLDERKDKDEFIIVSFRQIGAVDYFKRNLQKLLSKYTNNKKVLVIMEPPVVAPFMYLKNLHKKFDLILTRNNNLVNSPKYHRIPFPFSMRTRKIAIKPFKEKKFLTLINGNKHSFIKNELYSWRERAIRYYEKNGKDFDLYGTGRDSPNLKQKIFGYKTYPSYHGTVKNKIETLSNYKFNICFENMYINGWVTEKIWDTLQARSIPIYRGASNITDYIPEKCFIDFRKFDKNFDKLTEYLENMSESEYNSYMNEINKFMSNPQKFKERFDEGWAENFLNILYKNFK